MVWPALLPPWKRTTMSARFDSQSMILPLPSSPHWAPITVTFAMLLLVRKRRVIRRRTGYSMEGQGGSGGGPKRAAPQRSVVNAVDDLDHFAADLVDQEGV